MSQTVKIPIKFKDADLNRVLEIYNWQSGLVKILAEGLHTMVNDPQIDADVREQYERLIMNQVREWEADYQKKRAYK